MKMKKAQGTLEYVIILTAIVAAVIIGVKHFTDVTQPTTGLPGIFDNAGLKMQAATDKLPK